MPIKMISLLACASLVAAAPALAHHSFAARVRRREARHAHGQGHEGRVDEPARAVLHRREGRRRPDDELEPRAREPERSEAAGWASNSLKEGDVVTVEGSLARSGANMANARVVTLANGSRVFARAAADGGA